jgi:hypothetical protein
MTDIEKLSARGMILHAREKITRIRERDTKDEILNTRTSLELSDLEQSLNWWLAHN